MNCYDCGHPASNHTNQGCCFPVEGAPYGMCACHKPSYQIKIEALREAVEKLLKCTALREGSCGQCEGEAKAVLEATK